jgi:hypothetical protein
VEVADVQVIIAQAGPLPITVSADIESDGPAVLTLAGSVPPVACEELNTVLRASCAA